MNKKILFLLFSIGLASFSMMSGQILLFREEKDSLISHCRSLNRQNTNFFNKASSGSVDYFNSETRLLFQPPKYCTDLHNLDTINSINDLSRYKADTSTAIRELTGYSLRLYADSYQALQSERGDQTKSIILVLMVFNVMGLASLAIFLNYDSEDIG